MEVEWFGMAENAAEDGRGALALIGVNQNVFRPPTLPATVKRALIILLQGEEGDPQEGSLSVRMEAVGPSDNVLWATSESGQMETPKEPSLPVGVQVVTNVQIQVTERGPVSFRSYIEFGSQHLEGRKLLYVAEPPGEPMAQAS